MTDWKRLAEAVELPIPPAQVELIAPRLEQLESDLRELVEELPIDTLPWRTPTNK
jgi:hypothetical protein